MAELEGMVKKPWSPFGIGGKRERVIILISAIVGIVAFIVLLKRNQANVAASEEQSYGLGTGTDAAIDMYGTPGAGYSSGSYSTYEPSTDVEGTPATTPVGPVQDFTLSYSQDTGLSFDKSSETTSGKSGGGFNIGFKGFSLGSGSKSSSSTTRKQTTINAPETFQASTTITNATPDTIASVEDFLQRQGGTAEQRMAHQKELLSQSEHVAQT